MKVESDSWYYFSAIRLLHAKTSVKRNYILELTHINLNKYNVDLI